MNRLLFILVVFILLTACAPVPLVTASPPIAGKSASQSAPSSTAITEVLNTPSPEPVTVVEFPTYTEYTSGTLWLRLFSPKDEDVVTQPVINVTGKAPAETVISVNDTIMLVSGDGNFSMPVTLEDGPNVIEMVASNINNDQIELVLTIVYEKE